MAKILITGGSGTLGKELIGILKGELLYPAREIMDITNLDQVEYCISSFKPNIIIHCAAYTDVVKAESLKKECWDLNVNGTLNLVKTTPKDTRFVLISTDYVFDGEKGNYLEEDTPNPQNFYSMTKVSAENIVKTCQYYNILRTSFCDNQWQHKSAFCDVLTNQDYVREIANIIARIINNIEFLQVNSILNVGTHPKSMYDLALHTMPSVRAISYADSVVKIPRDTSLKLERLSKLLKKIPS